MELQRNGEELARLEEEVATLRAENIRLKEGDAALRAENALLRLLFDSLPDGLTAFDPSWKTLFMNKAAERMLRSVPVDAPGEWHLQFGLFLPDMETPYPPDDLPITRAMRGEYVQDLLVFLRVPNTPEPLWLSCNAWPVHDEGGKLSAALIVMHDVTHRRKLEEDLAARTEALEASEATNVSLIGRLKIALRELSTPILEVWSGVLALPVIGVVDSQRSAEMMERLLHEVSRTGTRFVILDLTGVDTIDTETANHFLKLAQAVKLLGATCVLTGISPGIAQTMVALGTDLSIATLRNLKHGLEYCLGQLYRERGAAPAPAVGD